MKFCVLILCTVLILSPTWQIVAIFKGVLCCNNPCFWVSTTLLDIVLVRIATIERKSVKKTNSIDVTYMYGISLQLLVHYHISMIWSPGSVCCLMGWAGKVDLVGIRLDGVTLEPGGLVVDDAKLWSDCCWVIQTSVPLCDDPLSFLLLACLPFNVASFVCALDSLSATMASTIK